MKSPSGAKMLLVDTSVWIELFRKPMGVRPDQVGAVEDFVMCLPVVQEVLQGFEQEAAYRLARNAMLAFPIVESPLSEGVFIEAVELYRAARRSGITVRSGVDCLIAACAMRHDLTVVHRDRDFDALASISKLRVRRI